MPRLTRTQKFADLRDQLTTNSEPTLKTEQNSQYDDRLSKLQGFSSVEQPTYQQPAYEAPKFEQPVYQQPVQETSPLDDLMGSVNNDFDSFINNQANIQAPSISTNDSDMFDSLFNTNINNSTYGGTPLDFSVLDQKEKDVNVVPQGNFENLSNSIINDIIEAESTSTNKETPVETTPTYEETPIESIPTFEEVPVEESITVQSIDDFNPADEMISFFAEEPITEEIEQTPIFEQPQIELPVFEEPQVEESQVEESQVETPVYDDTQFNTPSFKEEQKEETPVTSTPEFIEVPVEANDEEFSNTVSLEISKIMDDLSIVEQREATQEIEATKIIENVEEVKPIVTPVVEDKDAVLIKNIAEIEAATESTMSDTIPFIVENKETEVEEEEEEGSNVILNIILIVLIIVLIAVLGLIVYYILKTKGIL